MKGQMTIIAIIMTFLAIVVFAAMYPVMSSVIGNATAIISPTDPMTAMLLTMIPMFIVIAIIASFWIYISGNRSSYE